MGSLRGFGGVRGLSSGVSVGLLACVCLVGAVEGARRGRRVMEHPSRQAEVHTERITAHLLQALTPKDTSYKCSGCLKNPDGSPLNVRIMYIDVWPATQNKAAKDAAEALGREYSCDDPDLAVPECFVAENWDSGWVGELAHNIVQSLQINVTAMTRANFSEAGYNAYKGVSSYTRCVWEVRVGHVDVCVGDFWETEPRREVASFTSAMDSDILKLGTLSVGLDDKFKAGNLLRIFDPFDRMVWLLNVIMVFVSAFLIWLVEEKTPFNTDYFCQLDPEVHLNQPQGLGKSIWLGLMAYVSGGAAHQGTTWPGRLIILGFGWFIYISVSSYTANLASFMMTPPKEIGLITYYADIIKKGGALCVLEAIEDMVESPGLTLETFDDYIPAIEGMYDRRCLATIVGKNEWRLMVRGGIGSGTVCIDEADTRGNSACADPDGETRPVQIGGCRCSDLALNPADCPEDCPDHLKYCSMLEVQDTDFQYYMNFALPVATHLEKYLSAWILYARQGGTTQRLRQKYIEQVSPNMCGDDEASNAGEESQSLDLGSMAGTFVISGTFMLFGVVWFYVEKYLKDRKARLEDGNGEGKLEKGGSADGVNRLSSPRSGPRSPGRSPHIRGQAETKFGNRATEIAASGGVSNAQYAELSDKISKQQRMLMKQDKQLALMMTLLTEMSERQQAKDIEASNPPPISMIGRFTSFVPGMGETPPAFTNGRRSSTSTNNHIPTSHTSTPANGPRDKASRAGTPAHKDKLKSATSESAQLGDLTVGSHSSADPISAFFGSISREASNVLGQRGSV
mmetsp:Transcript_6279/g.14664  ORF Transcript_6279/g.14664 Transcript_6279/m.14664 type:complete len:796 (-) Transcript_6279:127-2514(-)|eukprot:CAMPEP_0169456968 /NCGR_PEP_ID=MMETSP1042-20121227/16631_1 /TAXON_ID=464988 /ORGANISM="Hemiselmis andersenii, Strain CCMP1180" /LENGTH=795 /DNA_ID=CAMNT_0009569217 /DNA_START=46 /DNA_END=2433 /DNA_ORIENTATION=-